MGDDRLREDVRRKVERKERGRRERRHGIWFGIGMFGLVGWSVIVPVLAMLALGSWLDDTLDDPFDWTMALLLAGIVLGCLNAWFWVSREMRHD
jgi:ATP synthase protein I